MTIMNEYIIIYLNLVIHETTSIYFNRNLCLETVARFINHQDKCHFDLSTADDILQDDTTCPYKCNFRMDNLDCYINSLRRTDLTIGNRQNTFWYCSNYYTNNRNSYINCSSWNAWGYIIRNYLDVCFKQDAQCVRINNYCICHCMPGYTLVNGNCFKNMVEVGGICKFEWQCRGAEFANKCSHGLCSCSSGQIQIDRKCYPGNLKLDDSCDLTEQCIQPFSVCFHGKCKCVNGYFAFDTDNCLKDTVPVGGFCNLDKQCTGSNNSGICENGRCTCAKGFTVIDLTCEKRNLELNDSCELTEQCIQPFSVCFQGKCKCLNCSSAFETDRCLNDTVPVGGFCNLRKQCTRSNNSGICENGRCTCAKEFTSIDLACEKNTNIGVTLGTLFGGFILGVIVTAVVTTLMYRRLKFRTRKREEPDVMFAGNREYGTAGGAQISFTNNKKQNVEKLSPYSFSKETQGYNLSRKQEDERTEDVYNHLHEQTEQADDTYDHACVAQNHSTDLSDYSNIRDTATVRPSPSKDGDDYSTLRH